MADFEDKKKELFDLYDEWFRAENKRERIHKERSKILAEIGVAKQAINSLMHPFVADLNTDEVDRKKLHALYDTYFALEIYRERNRLTESKITKDIAHVRYAINTILSAMRSKGELTEE